MKLNSGDCCKSVLGQKSTPVNCRCEDAKMFHELKLSSKQFAHKEVF